MAAVRQIAIMVLVAICSTISTAARAQEEAVQVRAFLSRESITEEDIVELIISVSNARSLNEISVEMPALSDFEKLSEQTSTQMTIINNRRSSVFRYIYILHPLRQGTLTIPSMNVDVAGTNFATEPLRLRVSRASTDENIIVLQRVSRTSAYVGQQIALTTELLYRDVEPYDYDYGETPSLEGFIVTEEPMRNTIATEVEHEGKIYYQVVLRRQILFPVAPGRQEIEQITLRIQYRERRIRGYTRIAQRSSRPIRIDVTNLPVEGEPAAFLGAVGDYEISWSASEEVGMVGVPLTLRVQLDGNGDIERAPELRLPVPQSFEIISSSASPQTRLRQGWWGGRKEWEYIVIPNEAGQFELGPLEYHFFDPENGSYAVASAPAITLPVDPAPPDSVEQSRPAVGLAQPLLPDEDIRFIRTEPSALADAGEPFEATWLFWFILLLAPAANAACVIFRIVNKALSSSERSRSGRRRQRAFALAMRKIRNASDPEELGLAIRRFLGDKLGLQAEGLTFTDVEAELTRRDLHTSEQYDELRRLAAACQSHRYAPGEEKKSIEELTGWAQKVLTELERLL